MKVNPISAADRNLIAPLQVTLWQCEMCDSLISIHSRAPVVKPLCPVCGGTPIEFCGALASILNLPFADA